MMKTLATASLVLLATPAFAASEDAWAEFAKEVEQGCLAATADIIEEPAVVVDPFGSETYGMAVVTGEVAPGTTKSIVCVFDKKSKAARSVASSISPPLRPHRSPRTGWTGQAPAPDLLSGPPTPL